MIPRHFVHLVACVSTVCVLLTNALAGGPAYRLVDLGALKDHPIALAKGISQEGLVVGSAVLSAEMQAQAVLFDRSTVHALGTLGGKVSVARAINKDSVVVGRSGLDGADRSMRAFVWTKKDGMQELPWQEGRFSSASAINEEGVIVGAADNDQKDRHAVIWEVGKGGHDLGTLGGQYSNATAVNKHKQVAGRSGLANQESHAFIWSEEGGMRDLGALEGKLSGARAMNDRGDVVGYLTDSEGKVYAFLWDEKKGMRTLDKSLPETTFSIANAINNQGLVVGIVLMQGQHRAFVWDEELGMRDLNTLIDPELRWRLHYATAINNKGEIAGVGQQGGHFSAFLLIPNE